MITVIQSERLNQFSLTSGTDRQYGVAEGVLLLDPSTGAAYNAAQQYVWDTGTLAWIKAVPSGGGGAGGAATIADGADVAEGATTDAAVVSDVAGTVSGKLRGLVKILASVWDSGNGRLKVDGSAVTQPVSGTVSVNLGLTDTQLRATAVPISGAISFTAPQHVVADSGTITAVTAITNALPAGGNLLGKIGLDQTTPGITNKVSLGTDVVITAEAAPTAVTHGVQLVTTAGTRVQLPAGACKAIAIKALATNTGLIYVGGVTVAAANGFQLSAGDSISPDVSNSNMIYLDALVNGEGVTWLAVA